MLLSDMVIIIQCKISNLHFAIYSHIIIELIVLTWPLTFKYIVFLICKITLLLFFLIIDEYFHKLMNILC